MKNYYSVAFIFLFIVQTNTNGQSLYPNDLIVNAINLNFRTAANTSSKVIDQLENGEQLKLIKIIPTDKELTIVDQYYKEDNWMYVERLDTGEKGYVFGQYITSAYAAYTNYGQESKIRPGHWYAISEVEEAVTVRKTNPKIVKNTDDFSMIVDANLKNESYLLCLKDTICTGNIQGNLFSYSRGSIRIGESKKVFKSKEATFHIAISGNYELDGYHLKRKNEKIFLIKQDNQKQNNVTLDLSKYFLKFGEHGYNIRFCGDLNSDGIPELIITEADNNSALTYFFMSNSQGELELKSLNWSYSTC